METKSSTLLKNRLSKDIKSCSLEKDELRKLCEILRERNRAAADIEFAEFKQLQQTDEQFDKTKEIAREAFELKPTIISSEGSDLYGSIEEVFDSPNFPESVEQLYLNGENTLRAIYNYYPRNTFELLLDFSKPDIFDLTLAPSDPTPNRSRLVVQGYESTWTNGVFNEVINFLKQRPAPLSFLHKQSVYDVFVWVVGFPFAFWVSYKASGVVQALFSDLGAFVISAAYLYVFLFALILLRILFHYARWVWPLIEYRSSRNKAMRHRAIIAGLAVTIFSAFIYDILRIAFTG